MVWFGCCGDFGRKSSRSKPQLLKTCSSGPNFLIQDHGFPARFAKFFFTEIGENKVEAGNGIHRI